MTPERELKEKLIECCNCHGLEVRKLHYEGRAGCPDWLIFGRGKHIFVELKGPRGHTSTAQILEFNKLKEGGFNVYVCNNTYLLLQIITREFLQ